MKVFLASTGIPRARSCIPELERLAGLDPRGEHGIVDDPADADLVLFTECHLHPRDWRLRAVTDSLITERHREKVYVLDERDDPWCALPGLYVSMPRQAFDPRWQVATGYYLVPDPRSRLGSDPGDVRPDLLFSFAGTASHRCRRDVLALTGPRAHVERVEGFVFYDPGSRDFELRRVRFVELLLRSAFVLCPRGHGTSSIRLYETMALGRAPVVISDDWVPPSGPDWESFAIRWPQSHIAELPRYLASIEDSAERRGRLAKEAFDEWFAEEVAFDRLMSRLESLADRDAAAQFPAGGVRGRRFVEVGVAAGVSRVRVGAGRLRRSVLGQVRS